METTGIARKLVVELRSFAKAVNESPEKVQWCTAVDEEIKMHDLEAG